MTNDLSAVASDGNVSNAQGRSSEMQSREAAGSLHPAGRTQTTADGFFLSITAILPASFSRCRNGRPTELHTWTQESRGGVRRRAIGICLSPLRCRSSGQPPSVRVGRKGATGAELESSTKGIIISHN